MEAVSSLLYSQAPATCPNSQPTPSSPYNPFHFLKIHLNIILQSTSWSRQWFFPSGFPTKTFCTPYVPHTLLLDFIKRTILGEEYRSLSSSLCNFLHSLVTPSLLGPNIPLNTLFSNTLSLCSSLNVSDQVSHYIPHPKIKSCVQNREMKHHNMLVLPELFIIHAFPENLLTMLSGTFQ